MNINNKVNNFRSHYFECESIVKKYSKYIENNHILDIGSNVGFFSEVILKNLNYKSIHLFEPSKEYLEYSKNCLSQYKNTYFNNYGLSNKEEIKTLYKCPTKNLGWNTFLKKDPNQPDTFFEKNDKRRMYLEKIR